MTKPEEILKTALGAQTKMGGKDAEERDGPKRGKADYFLGVMERTLFRKEGSV